MSIAPAVSPAEFARGQTRLVLASIIKVFEGTSPHDRKHNENLAWCLGKTTEVAADPAQPFCGIYREMFLRALTPGEADELFGLINGAIERYRAVGRRKEVPTFTFEQPAQKERAVALLTKLAEHTSQLNGFHIPYPNYDLDQARDHRQCTGL